MGSSFKTMTFVVKVGIGFAVVRIVDVPDNAKGVTLATYVSFIYFLFCIFI